MSLTFTVAFSCDNGAFEDCLESEIRRILERTAGEVSDYTGVGPVRDSNGNRVGFWSIEDVDA